VLAEVDVEVAAVAAGMKRCNLDLAASIVAADSAAAIPADFRQQIAVEATSAGTALFDAESPAKSSSEDVAAQQTAGVAVVAVVVVAGGSCSWPPAGFATDFAAAELERSRRKARPWPVAASGSLLAASALGHMAMKLDIGLVRWYIDLALGPGHN